MIAAEPDPTLLADVLLAHPDVAGLDAGPFGEVASYLPGRRVNGVRVGDDAVEVHLVGYLDRPIPGWVGSVRRVLAPLAGTRRVDIVVADLVDRASAVHP